MKKASVLKCYQGNLDGLRRGLIIAATQKVAAEIAGCSLNGFRDYWNLDGNWPEQELKTKILYTKPYDSRDPWIEGLCKVARN